jgi:hypothetical protein
VIGIRVWIEPQDEVDQKSGYFVIRDNDQVLSISAGPDDAGGMEIVFRPGSYQWLHGHYEIDGYFVPKWGGMHQGVISVGMEPVSEAVVDLSPNVRIRDIQIPGGR